MEVKLKIDEPKNDVCALILRLIEMFKGTDVKVSLEEKEIEDFSGTSFQHYIVIKKEV